MAVQITSDNFEEYFLRTQEQYSDSLEQEEGARGASVVTDLDSMKRTLVIPGVNYNQDPIANPAAQAQEYVQIPYSVLSDELEAMEDATEDATEAAAAATTAAGNVQMAIDDANAATSAANTAAGNANDKAALADTAASSANSAASSANTAASNANDKAALANTAAGNANTATGNANTATSNANSAAATATAAATEWTNTYKPQVIQATTEANNVNAQLVGFTVTITNRQGVSTSVDIGFEIYRTYTSVSAMNADAANVPQGKFVVIATTDATDPDNAKMYCKNSQGSFTFLCDLDQASSSAWADWLNNQKPLIIQATADANAAALLANTKAGLADDAATLANTKAQYAESEGDRAKGYNDHPWEIGNDGYIYVWDETTEQMVQTNKLIINWSDMTEQQRQAIIDAMLADIVFASVQTCEDLVDELI